MTRKDFDLISSTIREYRAEMGDDLADQMAKTFARKLTGTNPNFNYVRFIAATH